MLAALSTIDGSNLARLMVRINSLRTLEGIEDIRSLLLSRHALGTLVLPKVETDDEVRWATSLAANANSAFRFVPIIETTSGLEHCRSIAAAGPRLAALFFGGFDLSAALGADMAWEPLLYARSRVVHAAANSGVQVLDSPYPRVGDDEGLGVSALQARSLGMTGKTAKHRVQIATINAVFSSNR